MKVLGNKEKLMVQVSTCMQTVLAISEVGITISRVAGEQRPGPMAPNMRANT